LEGERGGRKIAAEREREKKKKKSTKTEKKKEISSPRLRERGKKKKKDIRDNADFLNDGESKLTNSELFLCRYEKKGREERGKRRPPCARCKTREFLGER